MAYPKNRKDVPDTAAFQTLKKQLSSGEIGTLYLFYGEETYLRDYYLNRLRKKLLTGGLETFNYHILSAKDCSVHRLRELIETVPLMGERTLIVVHDYDIFRGDTKAKGAMETLLRDLPDYVCLVFLYDVIAYKPDNRLKLTKTVKEIGLTVNFPRQTRADLINWIIRHFRADGHDISRTDAEYLITQCGDLMTTLHSEISKINAYARNKQVSRAEIDAVVIPQLNARVFGLTNDISVGNFERAFHELSDLLRSQEEPIQIMGALSWQIRRLYAAKLTLEHKKGIQWFMEVCGISYREQANQLLSFAQRFSLAWCRRAVLQCEETDLAMKSTGFPPQELLTDLLLRLSPQQ